MEGTVPEAALFNYSKANPIDNRLIERCSYIDIHPTEGSDSNSSTYNFVFDTNDTYCYDLASLRLTAYVSVRSKQNGPVRDKASDPISVSLLPLDTVFEKMTMFVQDQPAVCCYNHPFKAFLEKSLMYSHSGKAANLAGQLYYMDYNDKLDYEANAMFLVRLSLTENGQEVYTATKPSIDITNTTAYIPGALRLALKLERSNDALALNADFSKLSEDQLNNINSYYINIRQLRLTVKRCELTGYGQQHVSAHLSRPLYFFVPSVKTVTVHIPPHSTEWSAVLPFSSVPNRTFTVLMDTQCLHGDHFKNSFFFKHHNLRRLTLKCDSVPVDTVTVNEWTDSGALNAYLKLLQDLRASHSRDGIDLTLPVFTKGPLTIFSLCGGSDPNIECRPTAGQARMDFSFSKPVSDNGLVALVFGMFNCELMVYGNNVQLTDL